jgi:altronate hydrolase
MGGSTVLTEVPEMFGAETLLMNRAVSEDVFHKTVDMINGFKRYFTEHGQVVYENPSPGNKEGGISTLEDKSLGCIQKGGTAPVQDVVPYAGKVTAKGLTLLAGPGNDLVSTTALAAAGAHIILFTTGRGTPFGSPVPTLKISSKSVLALNKRNWIDFDAGTIAAGESIADASERLMRYVIGTASGKYTKAEENGFREIAVFKDGVTL